MIKISNLSIGVGDKKIINDVNLEFELGKNYLIIGKNGSGKSTLANFIMGNPFYTYLNGTLDLILKNEKINLLNLSPDERNKLGIFLSFQNIPEIEGVKLSEFLRVIYNIHLKNKNPELNDISPFIFKRFIKNYLEELNIGEEFLDRDINAGFSGGEKKKIEILQMKLIDPNYIILDEIDSGLDLDSFKNIVGIIKSNMSEDKSFIIISHQFDLLKYIDFDEIIVIKDGEIKERGNKEIVNNIKEKGFM